jgi:hypothetical protein
MPVSQWASFYSDEKYWRLVAERWKKKKAAQEAHKKKAAKKKK